MLKMHLGTLGLKMGGLACLCFPGRRKVNPKDNAISDEQRDCKPPDVATTPTGLPTIYISIYLYMCMYFFYVLIFLFIRFLNWMINILEVNTQA